MVKPGKPKTEEDGKAKTTAETAETPKEKEAKDESTQATSNKDTSRTESPPKVEATGTSTNAEDAKGPSGPKIAVAPSSNPDAVDSAKVMKDTRTIKIPLASAPSAIKSDKPSQVQTKEGAEKKPVPVAVSSAKEKDAKEKDVTLDKKLAVPDKKESSVTSVTVTSVKEKAVVNVKTEPDAQAKRQYLVLR
jgi:hypothetical protein